MRPKLNHGIIFRKEKDYGIIFDTKKNKEEYYNEIGSDIISLCDGENELSQILDFLKKSYEADGKQIEEDLLEFIAELTKKEIISGDA